MQTISAEQLVTLAEKMIAACDGATICTIKQYAALSVVADYVPAETAAALSNYLAQLSTAAM